VVYEDAALCCVIDDPGPARHPQRHAARSQMAGYLQRADISFVNQTILGMAEDAGAFALPKKQLKKIISIKYLRSSTGLRGVPCEI